MSSSYGCSYLIVRDRQYISSTDHTYAHRLTVHHSHVFSSVMNATTSNVSVCRINEIRWFLCESISRLVISRYLHSRKPRSGFFFQAVYMKGIVDDVRGTSTLWKRKRNKARKTENGCRNFETAYGKELLYEAVLSSLVKLASFSLFLLFFLHFSLAILRSKFLLPLFPPSYCSFFHFFICVRQEW